MNPVALSEHKRIVIMTGAGISAESGLRTFRDADGLWENHRVEDVATPEAFERDPVLVWRFYSLRRWDAGRARPNPAHLALDRFAQKFPGQVTLVTQNVDTLHERARGSGHLDPLCMHGSLEKSRCCACGQVYLDDQAWLLDSGPKSSQLLRLEQKASPEALFQYEVERTAEGLPLSPCCGQLLRPHIVWFGEMPLLMERIQTEVERCDLFVSIGTSGLVYPAAAFIEIAKAHGARTVCLNLEMIPQSGLIDEFVKGPASQIVPRFFEI